MFLDINLKNNKIDISLITPEFSGVFYFITTHCIFEKKYFLNSKS